MCWLVSSNVLEFVKACFFLGVVCAGYFERQSEDLYIYPSTDIFSFSTDLFFFSLQGNIEEERTTIDTASTEKSLYKHEEDSGVERADESSEQVGSYE